MTFVPAHCETLLGLLHREAWAPTTCADAHPGPGVKAPSFQHAFPDTYWASTVPGEDKNVSRAVVTEGPEEMSVCGLGGGSTERERRPWTQHTTGRAGKGALGGRGERLVSSHEKQDDPRVGVTGQMLQEHPQPVKGVAKPMPGSGRGAGGATGADAGGRGAGATGAHWKAHSTRCISTGLWLCARRRPPETARGRCHQ